MNKIIASGMLALLVGLGVVVGWLTGAPAGAQTTVAGDNDGQIDLYFIGKRRSQIEPCGCQTKQRGGVQYESLLYHQHPGRPTIRVDAGEWTRPVIGMEPVESLKTRYLLRAMDHMKTDAANVSYYDTQFAPAFYKALEEEVPDLTDMLVSANVFRLDAPDEHAFHASRVIERQTADGKTVRVGITGATSLVWQLRAKETPTELKTDHYLLKDPAESLAPVIDDLRSRVDLLIVLYSSIQRDELQKLSQRFPQIDFLVTTSYLVDPRAMILRDGQVFLLSVPNSQGKELGVVSLRRAALGGGWTTAAMPESLYVSLDLPVDEDMEQLIEDFKKETQDLPVQIPSRYEIKEIYAGAKTCAACHGPIYQSWQKTGHSRALQTLINVGQQFNPDCVKCHVTGYQHENGFYTVSDRPSLTKANVQCEVCHGPAQRHVTLQQQILGGVERWKTAAEYQEILHQAQLSIPPAAVAAETCTQCHQGDNDPNFDFDAMVHHIDHSDVATTTAAADQSQ